MKMKAVPLASFYLWTPDESSSRFRVQWQVKSSQLDAADAFTETLKSSSGEQ